MKRRPQFFRCDILGWVTAIAKSASIRTPQ
jgi:hypothetical protein